MEILFTAEELIAATGAEPHGHLAAVSSISIDSRTVEPGALFVAIRGDTFDGHDFVAQAFAKGAVAALVSRQKAVQPDGALLVVEEPLEGLRSLARLARQRSTARVVAVTGSVGKTTTKEALRLVLSAAGATHASPKSFNNHWGVPLTLSRLPSSDCFAVFEIGMNHAGEITSLVELVRPDIALITAIAPAHLEQLGSLSAIALAKAEIFSGLSGSGTAIVNIDHDQTELLLSEAERYAVASIITYGYAEGADWRIVDYQAEDAAATAKLVGRSQQIRLRISAAGRHMMSNAVGALLASLAAGVPENVALSALTAFGAQEGRGRRIELGTPDQRLVLIDESYNANTASVQAALEVFAGIEPPGGRKVVILGDMLELGELAPQLHAGLADAVKASGATRVFLVGPQMRSLEGALAGWGNVRHYENAAALRSVIGDALAYGDAVMIKGSNGVRLSGLVEEIRHIFG